MSSNDHLSDQERIIALEDRCNYLNARISNLYEIINKHIQVTATLAGLSPEEYSQIQAEATRQVTQGILNGSDKV
jgi:hypothetical protein